MRSIRREVTLLLLAAALGAGALAPGCSVSFDDDASYVCASDADCGGDGYRCVAYEGRGGSCCKPEGEEACDGRDNDCNGVVDDVTAPSVCPEAER